MIKVLLQEKVLVKEQESGYDFNLSGLQRKLEAEKFYGAITLVFNNGQIVLIKEERTLKPGQFDRFV